MFLTGEPLMIVGSGSGKSGGKNLIRRRSGEESVRLWATWARKYIATIL